MCGKCCCRKKVADAEEEILYVKRSDRKCTDCLFCILFIVFWLGMVIIAAVAIPGGDPERLLYGIDHEGKVCGGSDRSTMKQVYYPRITEDIIAFARSGETNPLKIKLFGLCRSGCPSVGDVTCTATGRTNVEAVKTRNPGKTDLGVMSMTQENSNYWANPELSEVKKGCWIVPLPTKEYFFRCLWQRNRNTTVNVTCEEPEYLRGVQINDDTPDSVKDACVSKRVRTESDEVGAGQKNPLLDQMFDAAEQMGRYVSDAQKAVLPILICGGIFGLIMGFIWLLVLQMFAGCMVWLTIWLVIILLICGTLYSYFKAGILTQEHLNTVSDSFNKAAGTSVDGPQAPEELNAAEEGVRNRWKWFAFFVTGVTIVVVLLILVLRTKIKRAIAMIKEAARAVKSMPLMMTFPFCSVLAMFVLMAYWVTVAGYVYSNGDISTSDIVLNAASIADNSAAANLLCPRNADGSTNITNCVGMDAAATFDKSAINNYLLLYHFFGLLWTSNFITGFFTMCIAGAVCIRYFSTSKRNKSKVPVMEALRTTLTKHLGSVAFGSLVIAIVQLIRAILAYLDRKSKKLQDANVLVKYIFKCLACCLWCFEKCIKYIATSAYIMVAMKGKSFCPAAIEAVGLLLKNLSQVGVLNVISAFLFVLGKLMIMSACGFLVFVWIDNDKTYSEGDAQLYSFWSPVLLTIILAYAVAAAFMNVLGLAIDTILLCFCVDVGRSGAGTMAKPYFASKSMLKAIGKGDAVSHEDKPTSPTGSSRRVSGDNAGKML